MRQPSSAPAPHIWAFIDEDPRVSAHLSNVFRKLDVTSRAEPYTRMR